MAFETAKGLVRLETGATPAEELGFRPRAVVLWWCRERPAGCIGGMGFATDGAGEASTAWVASDAPTPSLLSHWGADTALLLYENARMPEDTARGHIRFADRGFSLECDREPEHPWLVHYLAVGGSDVRDAAVRSLVLDGTGRSAVTGLGFAPDVVLAVAGAGSTTGAPLPGLAVAFGAATQAGRQGAAGFIAQADPSGRTIVRGAQRTDAVAVLPEGATSGEIGTLSRLVSFTRDGLTLETTHSTSKLPLAVLALAGGRYSVGLGDATSRATAVGFEPAGALLFGTGLAAMMRARDIGRLCLGGFSRDLSAGCLSWSVRARGASPLDPRSRSTADGAFEVIDTTSGELHARATLSTLSRRRFSLAWPVRDRYPRNFGYVAFGSEPRKPRLRDRLGLLGRDGSPGE